MRATRPEPPLAPRSINDCNAKVDVDPDSWSNVRIREFNSAGLIGVGNDLLL
jgi:hypothetical protein